MLQQQIAKILLTLNAIVYEILKSRGTVIYYLHKITMYLPDFSISIIVKI